MAKKKVAPAAATEQAPHDPHRLDGTMCALNKARAAAWFLNELEHGYRIDWGARDLDDAESEEMRGWLVMMGHGFLDEALDEAEAAYRKSRGETKEAAA